MQADDGLAADTALDTGGCTGKLDSSGSSCMSGISSMIDSQGSCLSRIEIHDFLDESSGSAADGESTGGSGDNGGSGTGGRGELGVGEGHYGSTAGVREDGNSKGVWNGTLNTEDISFLAESRELREAMLAVGDLHLGGLVALPPEKFEVSSRG